MKKVKYVTIMLLLCMVCSGCFEDLTSTMERLSDGVDALQGTTQQLVTDGVIEAERVNELNENIDKVQVDIRAVNEAVASASDPVDAVQKGWDASKPFNPYYGYGVAILAALRLFMVSKEKKTVENKYSAAKRGMNKFRNDNPDKAPELFKDIGEMRDVMKVS